MPSIPRRTVLGRLAGTLAGALGLTALSSRLAPAAPPATPDADKLASLAWRTSYLNDMWLPAGEQSQLLRVNRLPASQTESGDVVASFYSEMPEGAVHAAFYSREYRTSDLPPNSPERGYPFSLNQHTRVPATWLRQYPDGHAQYWERSDLEWARLHFRPLIDLKPSAYPWIVSLEVSRDCTRVFIAEYLWGDGSTRIARIDYPHPGT